MQLVDTDAGSGDVLLGETTTDPGGRYEVSVAVSPAALEARHKTQPDLQVRVLSGSTFLAASEVRYHASTTETLAVTLPAGVPAPEQADGYLPSPDVLARRPDSTGESPPGGALPTSAGQPASADTPAARMAPATAAPTIALRPAATGGRAADPSSPRLAGPGGDPGGSGGDPGKPGQWRVYVACVVRSPGDGAAISGAEPGAQFAVVVQASATADNGPAQEDVDVRVSVAVDGRKFAATQDPDGNFTAQCRVYRSGLLTVTATATAVGFGGGSKDYTVHVQASLDSASASLTVIEPAAGSTVLLAENGADVPVRVTMADANLFGRHTVVVQLDGGAPAELGLSAGSTTQYAGAVHLTAMPLGSHTLTITGTCAYETTTATTRTLTVVGADAAPPSLWVTHPGYNGLAAATPSETDPDVFTVWISGGAADAQSGMVGGQASVKVAVPADGPLVTATPGSPGDWSSWTVDALPFTVQSPPADGSIVPLGIFPLFIQATDAVGNATSIASSFQAIKAWVPKTLDDGPDGPGRLSSLEYLRDLINFARDNMWWTPPVSPPLHPISKPLSADGLAQVLGQPIDAISQPTTPRPPPLRFRSTSYGCRSRS